MHGSPAFGCGLLGASLGVLLFASARAQVAWTQLAPQHSPTSRRSEVIAYDAARRQVVLFGGHDWVTNAFLTDTWVWNGSDWTELLPAHAPSPRYGAAMAFDGARGVCVLFGGIAPDGSRLGDTWEWDGADWTSCAPASSPSPRFRSAMVFDPLRARCVLFGGFVTSSARSRELWEYDGATWTSRTQGTPWPPVLAEHGMTWDSRRQRAVMFGGSSTSLTWEWDGVGWSVFGANPNPGAGLAFPAMTFDVARERVVLTQGEVNGATIGRTWEWDGIAWRERAVTPRPYQERAVIAYDAQQRRCTAFLNGQTWRYGPLHDAEYLLAGEGCAGSNGVPELATSGAGPFAGETFTVTATHLPLGPLSVSIGLLGFSATEWNGQALPLELGSLGMPGCVLRNDIFDARPLGVGIGTAPWSVAIPADASLYGTRFFQQVLASDAGTNPFGLILSNHGRAEIGTR